MPVTVVDPPSERLPPRRTRDPLAIQFAKQVLADQPFGWVRLERRVGRSIVSAKARAFAKDHGVEFKVSLDHELRGDPTSDRFPHLFCRLTPVEDVQIGVRS